MGDEICNRIGDPAGHRVEGEARGKELAGAKDVEVCKVAAEEVSASDSGEVICEVRVSGEEGGESLSSRPPVVGNIATVREELAPEINADGSDIRANAMRKEGRAEAEDWEMYGGAN
jgi:hypothetical protein